MRNKRRLAIALALAGVMTLCSTFAAASTDGTGMGFDFSAPFMRSSSQLGLPKADPADDGLDEDAQDNSDATDGETANTEESSAEPVELFDDASAEEESQDAAADEPTLEESVVPAPQPVPEEDSDGYDALTAPDPVPNDGNGTQEPSAQTSAEATSEASTTGGSVLPSESAEASEGNSNNSVEEPSKDPTEHASDDTSESLSPDASEPAAGLDSDEELLIEEAVEMFQTAAAPVMAAAAPVEAASETDTTQDKDIDIEPDNLGKTGLVMVADTPQIRYIAAYPNGALVEGEKLGGGTVYLDGERLELPEDSYQWYFKGSKIKDDYRASLLFFTVDAGRGGYQPYSYSDGYLKYQQSAIYNGQESNKNEFEIKVRDNVPEFEIVADGTTASPDTPVTITAKIPANYDESVRKAFGLPDTVKLVPTAYRWYATQGWNGETPDGVMGRSDDGSPTLTLNGIANAASAKKSYRCIIDYEFTMNNKSCVARVHSNALDITLEHTTVTLPYWSAGDTTDESIVQSPAFRYAPLTEADCRRMYQDLILPYRDKSKAGQAFALQNAQTEADGTLSDFSKTQLLNMTNFIRRCAGVGGWTEDATKSGYAQAASSYLCKTDQLGHYAAVGDKANDPDGKADYGLQHSNLSYGSVTGGAYDLTQMLMNQTNDNDPTNITTLGHRRWLLDGRSVSTGFGYAYDPSKANATHLAVYVKDDNLNNWSTPSQGLEAYPGYGAFPVELLTCDAWSLGLGSTYRTSSKTAMKVTWSDGKETKTVTLTPGSSGDYFRVDTRSIGSGPVIIFRPSSLVPSDVMSLAGTTFTMEITGLTTSMGFDAEPIVYSTRFISLRDLADSGTSAPLPSQVPSTEPGQKPSADPGVTTPSVLPSASQSAAPVGSASAGLPVEPPIPSASVNPIEPGHSTDPLHPWDSADPTHPDEPSDPLHPSGPQDPLHPWGPEDPMHPGSPIEPEGPAASVNPGVEIPTPSGPQQSIAPGGMQSHSPIMPDPVPSPSHETPVQTPTLMPSASAQQSASMPDHTSASQTPSSAPEASASTIPSTEASAGAAASASQAPAPSIAPSSPASLSEDGKHMIVTPSTKGTNSVSVWDVLKDLDVKNGYAAVTTASGAPADETAPIATGMTVRIYNTDGTVREEYPVVVPYDVLGTGKIDLTQVVRLTRAYIGAEPLEGPYLLAASQVQSGKVLLTDLVRQVKIYSDYIKGLS